MMRFASISTEVKVSQWPDGKEVYAYKPKIFAEDLPINTISWGKNGAWLLLAPNFAGPEIIALGSNVTLLHTIRAVSNASCAVFQTTTKRNVALGTSNGEVLIYDVKDKHIKRRFNAQKEPIFKVLFTADDKHLVSACRDGHIYIYRTSSGNQVSDIRVPKSRTLTNLRCHPIKGSLVAGCSEEGIVAVWDYNVQKSKANYAAHNLPVSDVVLEANAVLSVGADRRFCMYDHRTSQLAMTANLDGTPSAIDLPTNAAVAVIGFTNGLIRSLDLRHAKQSQLLPTRHTSKVIQIAFDKLVDESSSLMDIAPETSSVSFKPNIQVESLLNQTEFDMEPSSGSQSKLVSKSNINDSFLKALHLNVTELDSNQDTDCDGNFTGGTQAFPVRRSGIFERSATPKPQTPVSLINGKRLESVAEDDMEKKQSVAPRISSNFVKHSSTPVIVGSSINVSDHLPVSSPIYPVNANQSVQRECAHRCLSAQEIKQIFKEAIREEIEPKLAEIKQETINHRFDIMSNVYHSNFSLHSRIYDLTENLQNALTALSNILQQNE